MDNEVTSVSRAHEVPRHGRVVSKHLYINEADEKRRRVVVQADLRAPDSLSLGLFPSRPVKVISKPSKKRQSVKNHELCLHHGSTISLFNRIRSQTVSTKYLGVDSGSHDPLPSSTGDGSGHSLPLEGNPPPWHVPGNYAGSPDSGSRTCFVARTGGWDPFAIWIVDTAGGVVGGANKVETMGGANGISGQGEGPYKDDPTYVPPAGFPNPPALARSPRRYVSLADGQIPESSLVPIHYNQLVVLQCLATGMVSPVMRVRKVDRSSTVVGGAHTGGVLGGSGGPGSSSSSSTPNPPFATDNRGMVEEEVLGDPVSQLHKVAFELHHGGTISAPPGLEGLNPPSSAGSTTEADGSRRGPWPGNPGPGAYLACLNDVVGVQAASEGSKKYVTPPSGVASGLGSGAKGQSSAAKMEGDAPGTSSSSTTTLGYWSMALQYQQQKFYSHPSHPSGGGPASPSLDHSQLNGGAGFEEAGKMMGGAGAGRRGRRATQPYISPLSKGSNGDEGGNGAASPPGPGHPLYHATLRKVNSVGNLSSSPGKDIPSSPSSPSSHLPYPTGGMAPNAGQLGAAWSEDVTDQAVWTIVGVDAIRYTFYHPSCAGEAGLTIPRPSKPITPVPIITQMGGVGMTAASATAAAATAAPVAAPQGPGMGAVAMLAGKEGAGAPLHSSPSGSPALGNGSLPSPSMTPSSGPGSAASGGSGAISSVPTTPTTPTHTPSALSKYGPSTTTLVIAGSGFTRDMTVWFGDMCSAQTEWRSPECLVVLGPTRSESREGGAGDGAGGPSIGGDGVIREVPILLVRSDGVVYRTGRTVSV